MKLWYNQMIILQLTSMQKKGENISDTGLEENASVEQKSISVENSAVLKTELQEKVAEYKQLLDQYRGGETSVESKILEIKEEMVTLKEKISALIESTIQEEGVENPDGYDAISRALDKMNESSELLYYSPDTINEIFIELDTEIPVHELTRMKKQITKLSLEVVKTWAKQLKEKTESKKSPLFLILPQVILLDGREVPFTIRNLDQDTEDGIYAHWSRKWEELKNTGKKEEDMQGFYVDKDYVPGPDAKLDDDTKLPNLLDAIWGNDAKFYTAAPIEGSKGETYDVQLTLVKETLGEGTEIHADMWIAMIIHYLKTGELLMKDDLMRLHEKGTDGDPLNVDYVNDRISLNSCSTYADDDTGIGSSVVPSRGVST